MRRTLVLTPAYHSNLAYALGALSAAGIDATLWTLAPGAPAGAPSVRQRLADPADGFAKVFAMLREIDPDLVVIRKCGVHSRRLYWAGLLQGRRMIAYDQRPYLKPRGRIHALSGWLRGRPMRRFTPVKGLDGAPDPFATYLPFPVSADASALAARRPPPPEGPRLLCVGKLAEARKRQPMLIEALSRLADRRRFTLTLVGSSSLAIGGADRGQLSFLRAQVREGPLAGRLRLVEDARFDAMPGLYAGHDLCILPSVAEPLGTAPLEAMAHGCAALVSDSAGSAAYVADALASGRDVGALFAADDIDALTIALDRLIADPAGLAARGAAAAEWARRAFAPADFATRFAALGGSTPSRG